MNADRAEGFTALVVAKAPVPGVAKTRLAADIGERAAADIAAAALLDTLQTVAASPARTRIVALTGQLADAVRGEEISAALDDFVTIEQTGDGLSGRLINAHRDAGAISEGPIVQIGMDTPQATAQLLAQAASDLRCETPTAVLGLAVDGGWWILGVQHAAAVEAIASVPTSQPNTGEETSAALSEAGLRVSPMPMLRDVDYADDLVPVAARCAPGSRFRAAVHALRQ